MEIMLSLTDYFTRYSDLRVEIDFDYINDVKEYFKQYKEHKAIKLLQEIIEKLSFHYDAPIALAWQLDKDYTIKKLMKYPFEDRLYGDNRIIEFLHEMKHFAEDTDYEAFYNTHLPIYNSWIDTVKKYIDESVLDYMCAFYKEDLNRKYIINLMPLQTNANYGVDVGDIRVCNLGIKYNSKKIKSKYYFIWESVPDASCLIQHEFSHPIINPLTDKYLDLDKLTPLPKDDVVLLEEQAYSEGLCYVCEQIIRASTIIYCMDNYKESADLNRLIEKEEKQGFIHTRQIYEALVEYQKQDIPLREYYPKLLEVFYRSIKKHYAENDQSL